MLDDFAVKFSTSPLVLARFLIIVQGIRYINLTIFEFGTSTDRLQLPNERAKTHRLQHFQVLVKYFNGGAHNAFIRNHNPNELNYNAIRFDWFIFLLIAAPATKILKNDARERLVKHWCGNNIPDPAAANACYFPYNMVDINTTLTQHHNNIATPLRNIGNTMNTVIASPITPMPSIFALAPNNIPQTTPNNIPQTTPNNIPQTTPNNIPQTTPNSVPDSKRPKFDIRAHRLKKSKRLADFISDIGLENFWIQVLKNITKAIEGAGTQLTFDAFFKTMEILDARTKCKTRPKVM